MGFCFGGGESFAFAANEPDLNAVVVYYGNAPGGFDVSGDFEASNSLKPLKAAILGFYGGLEQDPWIGKTLAGTELKMKEFGKVYQPHVFEGAEHAFLRAQTGANGANMKATEKAWPLTIAWLRKYTL